MRAFVAAVLLSALPSLGSAAPVTGVRVSFSDFRQPNLMAVVPPLVPGSPVRIVVNYSVGGGWTVAPPVGELHGNEITITQNVTKGGPDQSVLYLLDFGALPAGTYHATIAQSVHNDTGVFTNAGEDTFIVQLPPPSSPCSSTSPPVDHPIVAVTRTAAGTAHLHYEEVWGGYAPVWGTPSVVSLTSNGIGVEQPVTDLFDFTRLGAPPLRLSCHAEDLDLGVLPAGTYRVEWSRLATLGGHGTYDFIQAGTFVWSGSEMLCSSTPALTTSQGVTLSLKRVSGTSMIAPPTAIVSGNVITVTDYIDTEVPPPPGYVPPPPSCVTTSVNVGPLAPGDYTVNWYVQDFGPPAQLLGTYRFAVPPPRMRAVRH